MLWVFYAENRIRLYRSDEAISVRDSGWRVRYPGNNIVLFYQVGAII